MFKIDWDPSNNGIILSNNIEESKALNAPRPVYLDELKMLGLDQIFILPNSGLPICWEIDRKYYYKGELIAETHKGNIYDDPKIVIYEEHRGRQLQPIDIEKMLEINEKSLATLENEAMDFIKEKYEEYQKKDMGFVVAFSGGKDSQVILELVSRVIPHEKFKTVFTNTGMELPCTLDLMKITENYYGNKFPGFKLEQAKSDKSALDMWKSYGPPSRMNRWCCSVLKTALFGRKMKELLNISSQPRLVVFEGVRSEESAKRATYNRVGEGVKHVSLINCRPILKWNSTETYLYIYKSGIQINPAYTLGLTRVGCGVCPFASDWSEFVIRKRYPQIASDYIGVVEEMAKNIGITSKTKINDYVSSGNWKKNAGGKGLQQDASRMDIITKEPNFECIVSYPKVDWEVWFSTIGEYFVEKVDDDYYKGELKFKL